MKKIMSELDIPKEYLSFALKAFRADSQKGLLSNDKYKFTDKDWIEIDKLFAICPIDFNCQTPLEDLKKMIY